MSHSFKPPTQGETLLNLLRWRANHQSHQRAYTFLVDGEIEAVHLTYANLERQARAIGAWLQQKNAAGQPILLLYSPGLDFIAALFACFYAGAIAVPAYPPPLNRNSARLAAIMANTQAKIFLTTTAMLTQIQRQMAEIPAVKDLSWLTTDTWPVEMADTWAEVNPKADTLALLQYTSGSTATPKGVMVTHGNIIQNLDRVVQTAGFEPDRHREGVSWLPPYHDLGLIGFVFLGIYSGRPFTLMSPLAFIQKPLRWLQAISRLRASYSAGPNFAYNLCVDKITPEQRAELDLSCWKIAIVGADPICCETLERFAHTFAPYGFRQQAFYPSYGLAEATLVVSGGLQSALPVTCTVQAEALKNRRVIITSPKETDSQTLVGCGRSLVGQNVLIVDPQTLRPCPPDQIGEIWVAGPSVARGYWRQPEETQHTFQARLAGGNGQFLRTGDLGFVQEGELFITGRLKDLIIIRGCNYYPQDIEKIVKASHPALGPRGGAAFSVEIDHQEQLVIVWEVERRHRSVDVNSVAEAVRGAVAQTFELETYAVVLLKPGHLPKTTSGKIQRYQCRKQFLENTLPVIGINIQPQQKNLPQAKTLTGDTVDHPGHQQLQQQLEEQVRTQLAEFLKVPPDQIDWQRSIQTLGLGSLHATAVKYHLEENFGIALSPEMFFEDITLGQFVSKIASQTTSERGN
ncbi:MAG: AMP-binding protein [Anaerolineae bacterium]|nr:AMP-binding protein [Anaerolineae bacterium]